MTDEIECEDAYAVTVGEKKHCRHDLLQMKMDRIESKLNFVGGLLVELFKESKSTNEFSFMKDRWRGLQEKELIERSMEQKDE